MTASLDVAVKADGWHYPGLPEGTRAWHAEALLAGVASSGTWQVFFQFNPNQDNSYLPYVSVSRWSFRGSMGGVVELLTVQNQWEYAVADYQLLDQKQETAGIGSQFSAAGFETIYVGRPTAGTKGSLLVRSDDVISTSRVVYISGFMSDLPFIAPDTLRI